MSKEILGIIAFCKKCMWSNQCGGDNGTAWSVLVKEPRKVLNIDRLFQKYQISLLKGVVWQ
jgi:hypothetical protein